MKVTWKLGLILVPIAISAVGLYFFSTLPKADTMNIEGSVEISTTPYFSKVSTTVAQVLVETGQSVTAGQVLAQLDSGNVDNQLALLQAQLVIQNAQLNLLLEDPATAGIEAARKSAQSTVSLYEERLKVAQRSLSDAQDAQQAQQQLYEAGAIAKEILEQAQQLTAEKSSAVVMATAELAAAKSNVNTYVSPSESQGAIDVARGTLALTQLQIQQLESSKQDYRITAQTDGVVVSKAISLGSSVVSGQTLFDLSKENEKFFVFYLPEDSIEQAQFGSTLTLYPLNSSQPLGTATICYIDWKAVYTPKNFESGANTNKKSVQIKALIDGTLPLHVGETLLTKLTTT